MCSDDPNLGPAANKAKCHAIACFVFSIFSLLGFASPPAGSVGAVGGLLACIASSILMCCGPKAGEGGQKFLTAGVLLLIGGIIQLIMFAVIIVLMIMVLTAVHENAWCDKRYKPCTAATNGCSCTSGYSGYIDNVTFAEISSIDADWDDDTYCTGETDGLCYHHLIEDGEAVEYTTCSATTTKEFCEGVHGIGKAVVTGLVVAIMGISCFFLFIAGLLNTLGGAYCLKAKKEMDAKVGTSTTAQGMPPVAQGQVVQAVAVPATIDATATV